MDICTYTHKDFMMLCICSGSARSTGMIVLRKCWKYLLGSTRTRGGNYVVVTGTDNMRYCGLCLCCWTHFTSIISEGSSDTVERFKALGFDIKHSFQSRSLRPVAGYSLTVHFPRGCALRIGMKRSHRYQRSVEISLTEALCTADGKSTHITSSLHLVLLICRDPVGSTIAGLSKHAHVVSIPSNTGLATIWDRNWFPHSTPRVKWQCLIAT